MKSRIALYSAGVGVLTLASAGCGLDLADPEPVVPVEIKLDFCSNDIPIWFAVQNGVAPFEVIRPDAAGTFTFPATNRTGIAFVHQNDADARTEIIFTTSGDLTAISGIACLEESGSKQVSGSVAGVTGDQLALVGMSFSSVFLTPQQTSFTLTQLPDRQLDVIGSRVIVSGAEQRANRTIIRRSQNPLNGSTMAPFNFDATEGVDPVTQFATLIGVRSGDQAFLLNNFFSQLETSHMLSFADQVTDGDVPFASIPGSELAVGDFHDLVAVAVTPSFGSRGIERYFRNPANQTMTLGPDLAQPTVTTESTSPYVRMRMQLSGQVDYSTMVVVDFHQQTQFSTTDVSMSVTASYIGGTPFTWALTIPLFSEIEGWEDSWGLQSGPVDWTVTGYFGPPALVFGAKPNGGEVVQFASKMSSANAMQVYRSARITSRPKRFSR